MQRDTEMTRRWIDWTIVVAVFGACSQRGAMAPDAKAVTPAAQLAAPPKVPPQTAEECRACRGDWGKHGIAETESCNCRTNDGGKRCTDGADCQGVCIAATDNPELEVVDGGTTRRGFFVGKCSELVTVFGCNRIIDRGARSHGPVSPEEAPQQICVD